MGQQMIFLLSSGGVMALLTYWLSLMMFRSDAGKLRTRLRGSPDNSPRAASRPALGSVLQHIEAAAKPFAPQSREKQSEMRKRLARAGLYSPAALRVMVGCKFLLLIGGILGGYAAGMALDNIPLGASFGGLLGYLLPTFWLKSRIRKHQEAIDRGLPDVIDLLVVCVEAGLTVDFAMQRVGEELAIAHPVLSRELELTHMETRIGLSRAEALRNFAVRTGSSPVQGLTSMLIQAERFGTSIADALRIQAESLRAARQHQAEEMAAKTTVKLSFPVVLFIFPAVLIVLAGPAVIGLFKSAIFTE